ncbi:RTA1-domain-containing protein [Phellopilus nigrolimitatus]|nr:RTA1-domain-containing protein [Phellopilus nigrolimitatus]
MVSIREINPGLQYGYIPTEWICITFVSLFGISTFLHLVEAIYFRIWWLLPTVILAGIGETIGWSGRLWSSQTFDGNASVPYLMQISSTIIAPTPLVAANFIILGRIIQKLGPQYSRLKPRMYTIVFCSVDIAALVVQAVGGASASSATTDSGAEDGAHIMLAGIIIQLVAITFYVTLAAEFLFRYSTKRPFRGPAAGDAEGTLDHRSRLMIIGLGISTLLIFIRAVYRTIELADGWTGDVLRTQVFFDVLDGAMICIAIYTLNFFHPGFLLSRVMPSIANEKAFNDSRETTLSLRGMESSPGSRKDYYAGSGVVTQTQVV